jgi:hypothetical protein
MFWFVFDWVWDAGHAIFFGLWYAVIVAIGVGLFFVIGRTVADLMIDPLDYPGAPKDQENSQRS